MTDPQRSMIASTADGTLTVRQCTCTYTWGTDDLGHLTEVRRPGITCPTHQVKRTPDTEGSRP